MRHEAAARKTSRICTKAKAPEAMACFRVAATTLPRGLVHNFHHTFLPCEPQHAATEQTISAKLETIANRSMSRITYLRHTTKMPVRFLCFFFLAASQRRQMPFWQPAAPPRPERARRVLRRGWGLHVCMRAWRTRVSQQPIAPCTCEHPLPPWISRCGFST